MYPAEEKDGMELMRQEGSRMILMTTHVSYINLSVSRIRLVYSRPTDSSEMAFS